MTQLELDIRAIPGVVGTGLFLGMADTVLVGDRSDFQMIGRDSAGADPMDAEEKRATYPCKRVHELPPVSTDWQPDNVVPRLRPLLPWQMQ